MKNLYQKINDIQKDITSVFKGARVQVTQNSSYRAVSHDDVAALLHLPMANAGIAVIVDMHECKVDRIITTKTYNGQIEDKVTYQATVTMSVTFVNSDDPQDKFTVKSTAYAFDSGDKAVGKAESMAVKYVYLKNFNLESTDEEEQRDTETPRQDNFQGRMEPAKVAGGIGASDAQKNLMSKLGIKFDPTITKQEAMNKIKEHNDRGAR